MGSRSPLRSDVAAAAIGRRIVSGQLRPGEQLPTETALCDELGLSRTTVREAVKRLHGKGLLDGGPRRGMRVLPTAQWNQLDRDVLSWRMGGELDEELIDQLYAVRLCIEPAACHIVADRATRTERAHIAALVDSIADEAGDLASHIAADLAFHLAIFAGTANPFFVSMGEVIRATLTLAFLHSQSRCRISGEELALHRAVAAAIQQEQGDSAAEAMTRLLHLSREALCR